MKIREVIKRMQSVASHPSETPETTTLRVFCPICGSFFHKFGVDLVGSVYPFCSKCREERVVRVEDGKLVIELQLAGVYTPAENSGEHPKSG
jgi:hypothetical protein